MMGVLTEAMIDDIHSGQSACGAFSSVMVEAGVARGDHNAFVTAQVLRALGPHTGDPRLTAAVARALDFLQSCVDPGGAGGYRFWRADLRPSHVPVYPADADDTAVISLELARHGRLTREALRRTALTVLFAYRVPGHVDPPASWVVPGAFWTWLADDFGYNVVDCTVNTNVAALFARAGLTELSCFRDACAMVCDAVRAAGGDTHLTRLLSPYYPHPGELLLAVRAAVAAGAEALRPALQTLAGFACIAGADDPVFCSAYGRVTWHCPLLQRLRAALS